MTTSEYSMLTLSGGRPLHGTVRVAGFKHSLVLTVAYLVGRGGPAHLTNVPDLVEVDVYEELLPAIGVTGLRREHGSLTWTGVAHHDDVIRMPEVADRIHGSLYLLPALVATGRPVAFGVFGGCHIGDGPNGQRPWRHVVDVMCRFGARFTETADGAVVHAPDGFTAADVDLLDYAADRGSAAGPEYSGATKTAALAAALADGRSVLRTPYLKSELCSLLDVVEATGAAVLRNADDVVIKVGAPASSRVGPVRVPPDLIEAATWVTSVGVAGGRLEIRGVTPELLDRDLPHESAIWRAVGIEVEPNPAGDGVVVSAPESDPLAPMPDIDVRPDGIYSDCHPLLAVLATRCAGVTTITDQVWTNRYAYAEGLRLLGAEVTVDKRGVHIGHSDGLRSPAGPLAATDLRCAAAYLLASLRVPATTTVTGAQHLRRGYDRLVEKLYGMGVNVDAGH